ncbi:MAG: NAD(P)-dependent oxidoreductase, partial [Microcystaceae cyanobacterium]
MNHKQESSLVNPDEYANSLAFLGLGVMGGPMAANLASKGFAVTGWNRTSDRPGVEIASASGVKILPTIAEAVKQAQIIFTCLGDVPDVEEVLFGDQGVIHSALPQSLIVDFSTIGPKAAQGIAARLAVH